MPGFFNIKFLWIGLLLACPAVAVWVMREPPEAPVQPPATEVRSAPPSGENLMKFPVEIITKGGKSEWIYVEVADQHIPEASSTTLIFLTSLLLLRRQREK
ncbi:MAG: hypothetical protein Q8Q59_02490 [Luteolibacter sp.]|nr:hypothetical protein [Luteolibacter sp.]